MQVELGLGGGVGRSPDRDPVGMGIEEVWRKDIIMLMEDWLATLEGQWGVSCFTL